MDIRVGVALIGAAAAVLGAVITAIIGPWFTRTLERKRFRKLRENENIPNIIGRWKTEWYIKDKLLHGGDAVLSRWEKYDSVSGYGTGRSKEGYVISGDVDASRFFSMTYRNNEFPTVGFIGVGILKISADGRTMEGHWAGHSGVQSSIEGGRMKWSRE